MHAESDAHEHYVADDIAERPWATGRNWQSRSRRAQRLHGYEKQRKYMKAVCAAHRVAPVEHSYQQRIEEAEPRVVQRTRGRRGAVQAGRHAEHLARDVVLKTPAGPCRERTERTEVSQKSDFCPASAAQPATGGALRLAFASQASPQAIAAHKRGPSPLFAAAPGSVRTAPLQLQILMGGIRKREHPIVLQDGNLSDAGRCR